MLRDDEYHSGDSKGIFHRRDAECAETAQRRKKISAFPQRSSRLCGGFVSIGQALPFHHSQFLIAAKGKYRGDPYTSLLACLT
jgi:hypothetical protein